MDLEKMKNFIPEDGERYIFVENGKPSFVLMSFEDYKRNIKKNQNDSFQQTLPKISENKQLENSKEEGQKELKDNDSLANEEELRIEDLPF